jgi:hypothetical protein
MKRFPLFLALATLTSLATQLSAAPVPPSLSHAVPAGFQAGDTFQLLFVSRTVRNAQSTNIDDYNEFVNTVADSAGIGPSSTGVSWFAVASTMAVDGRDNAAVHAPIYNMQGELLALDAADMWDGSLTHAVNYDEHAVEIISFHMAWTGSRRDGTALTGRELGAFPSSEFGDLKRSDFGWIENSNGSPAVQHHLYALSEPLQVVPEPSVVALAMCNVMILITWRGYKAAPRPAPIAKQSRNGTAGFSALGLSMPRSIAGDGSWLAKGSVAAGSESV